MTADLVLTNGIVYTPAGFIRGGLAISAGRITDVGSDETLPAAESGVDARGNYVLPGIIDVHGIFGRGDWEPTARDESVHAAVNGVTTIITYVQMGDLTLPQRLPVHRQARELCERESFVDFKFNAALGTLKQIEEIPALVEDGVHSFNFWINLSKLERDQYGFPHLDLAFLYRAFEVIREVGPPAFASVHCEEPEIIHLLFERARAASTGRDTLRTWAATRPSFAEGIQAFGAGLVGLELGVPVAFVHVSAPETLDAIRYLRGRGARVYGETSPQYLSSAHGRARPDRKADAASPRRGVPAPALARVRRRDDLYDWLRPPDRPPRRQGRARLLGPAERAGRQRRRANGLNRASAALRRREQEPLDPGAVRPAHRRERRKALQHLPEEGRARAGSRCGRDRRRHESPVDDVESSR